MSKNNILLLILLLGSANSLAQTQTLKEVSQKAVLGNPEVLQRWHAYLATDGERDAAFGNYLPKLDLAAGRGHESRDDPFTKGNYPLNSTTLTLTQMLYDGFGTRNDVRRLDQARRVRMYELYDTSETVALEAGRAYFDVLRYRKMVDLAEENYVRHRSLRDQIQRRVKAGVGRRVDLEQAFGRLALAEANLLTETSNLHDVSARFLRIVGEMPAKEMEEPSSLDKNLPTDMPAALKLAQVNNPALRAAIENARSADSALATRKSAYQPRVDLRLRQENNINLSGVSGTYQTNTAEVVLSWNLFNGLSDMARSRQYAEQYNAAKDLRDKTCRDTRQTMAIAFNDTRKLVEQLDYLNQHQLSIEKARDAYRKQFDIGQRSLLDLLDTENELFQARRAYTNAEYDLLTADVRTYAAGGTLLGALGLSKVAGDQFSELAGWEAGAEAPEQCPAEDAQLFIANKASLNVRADEMLKDMAPPAPVQAAPPAQNKAVAEALQAWSMAWSSRNLQAYLDAYAQNFSPVEGGARETWAAKRKKTIDRAGNIALNISGIKIAAKDANHAATTFRQTYRSENYQDVISKTLEWERIDGHWQIVHEIAGPSVAP